MLFKALDESRRTRSRLKKELHAQILKGAILDFEKGEYSSEEYLYLISDLTEQEIRIGFLVYMECPPLAGGDELWKAWANKLSSEIGIDIADLTFALGRFVSSDLIDRLTSFEGKDGQMLIEVPTGDEGTVGHYKVTPGFDKLIRFVGLTR